MCHGRKARRQAAHPGGRRQIRRLLRLVRGAEARRRPGRARLDLGTGICHAYTPDGRCVSLLKILLTNYCLYDCAYCVNRRSSNVPRAQFSRRGGRRPDDRLLQAQLHRGAVPLLGHHPRRRTTRWSSCCSSRRRCAREHGFRGYIHLKTIPEASPWLIEQAGLLGRPALDQPRAADRGRACERLAPEKDGASIERAMAPDARAHRRGARRSAAASRPPGSRRR